MEFYATDPRDKVFALLGLANDASGMQVDYSKTTTEIYAQFVHYLIKTTKSLTILSMVSPMFLSDRGKSTRQAGRGSGPSWLPELNLRHTHTRCIGYQSRGYKASGDTTPSIGSTSDISLSLPLAGRRFDKLYDVLSDMFIPSADEGLKMEVDGQLVDPITWIWTNLITQVMPDAPVSILSGLVMSMTCGFARSGPALGRAQFSRERFLIDQHPEGIQPGIESLHADLCAHWLSVDPTMSLLSRECRNYLLRFRGLGSAESFHLLTNRVCVGRKFITTDGLAFGIAESWVRTDDLVVVLNGGTVPYILRPRPQQAGSDPTYEFMGECYIQARMDGRVVEEQRRQRKPVEMFDLR
jgi:hypothetical protein